MKRELSGRPRLRSATLLTYFTFFLMQTFVCEFKWKYFKYYYYYVTSCKFLYTSIIWSFTGVGAIFSRLRDFSQYSDRSQQCYSMDDLCSFSDFHSFLDFHVRQLQLVSPSPSWSTAWVGLLAISKYFFFFLFLFHFLWFSFCCHPGRQYPQIGKFFFY